MKILLTGFEPFGGETLNPSGEAVKNVFSGGVPCGTELVRMTVPVVWKESAEAVLEMCKAEMPDAVIMTGQAGGSDRVRAERVALNIRGMIKDINGNLPGSGITETAVINGAPDAVLATYDAYAVAERIRSAGVPACVSYSAGVYICNEIFYTVLFAYKNINKNVKAGFIHFPYSESNKKTGAFMLSDDLIVKAAETAVCTVAGIPD